MAGLIVILLYACILAFLTSSTCGKIIEFSLKNETRKAYLHVHKMIIIMPAIYERGLFICIAQENQFILQCSYLPIAEKLLFTIKLDNKIYLSFFTLFCNALNPVKISAFIFIYSVLPMIFIYVERRVCFANPCKNGGECVEDDSRYPCACPIGYSPPYCRGKHILLQNTFLV